MISASEFKVFQDFLKKRSGIILDESKQYLLESRLMPIARKHGKDGLLDLVQDIRSGSSKPVLDDIVDAMTTNETSFLRDGKPFQRFQDFIIPYLAKKRGSGHKVKLWSAACSSGQEPYTLAILSQEMGAKMNNMTMDILATDLSGEILDKARAGLYSQFEVQRGLPITMLVKYFTQEDSSYRLKDDIRNMVNFKPFNLLESYTSFGKFDIIFCRNVLIYFDAATKKDILERLADQIAPDGFLLLGSAETVIGITDKWRPLPSYNGLYVRSDSTAIDEQDAMVKEALGK